jgi:hypothetical protein
MKNILKLSLFSLVFLFLLPVMAFASGFQLKTLGTLNVDGVTYKQLWYTNGNVTFTGISPAGSVVSATIDGTTATATVDAAGNWTYTANLTEGDHAVAFSSSAGSLSFTLTIGPVPEGVGQLTPSELPTVGSPLPAVLAMTAGGLLVFLGGNLLYRRLKYRTVA